MNIRDMLRNCSLIYSFYRNASMYYKRKKYGLLCVDRTFYMSGSGDISKDFVAGAYSYVGDGFRICPKVVIGDYVMFGPEVTITGSDHRYDIPGTPMIFSGRPELKPTYIQSDVWIGHRSIIMAGVTIGMGSIIAANSVVTKDIPPFEIHGGVPAIKLRDRFNKIEDLEIHRNMLNKTPLKGVFAGPLEVSRSKHAQK